MRDSRDTKAPAKKCRNESRGCLLSQESVSHLPMQVDKYIIIIIVVVVFIIIIIIKKNNSQGASRLKCNILVTIVRVHLPLSQIFEFSIIYYLHSK